MSSAIPDTVGNPFAAALDYWQAGWRGILPLPYRRKEHPPAGWTGRGGQDPSWADISAWADERPLANLALRLPANVIGIDVDHYGSKPGGATLDRLEGELGALPGTWRSTSRDDGISGIRLYRIPDGLAWPNTLGDGIDVIRRAHRYVVAAPSIHPAGGTYKWITPDGAISLAPPPVDNLPDLPAAWINRFGRVDTTSGEGVERAGIGEVAAAIAAMPPARGDNYCQHIEAAWNYLDEPGSRHDNYNRTIGAIVYHGRAGCRGAAENLKQVRSAFLADIGPDRGQHVALGEYERSLAGAVSYALRYPQGDGCVDELVDDWISAVETAPAPEPGGDGDPVPADPTPYERQVRSKFLEYKIAHDARQLLDAELAAELPPIEGHNLAEFLATEDEPVEYLIEGLWPAAGRVMLSAQAKAGKSTMILNLLRSLADGVPFLNKYEVEVPDRRIAYLNLELGEAQLRRWFRNIGIETTDKIEVVNLRGRASALAINTPAGRDRFARWLREHQIGVVILDPLAPLLAALGVDENDNSGVASFFHQWNETLHAGGVAADFIAHHTGRATSSRSRGASRLDDEPDAIWTMQRLDGSDDDPDEMFAESAPRTLKAYGRDVDLPGITLEFDPETGLLSDSGEAPSVAIEQRRESAARRRIIEWVAKAGSEGRQYGHFGNSHANGGPPGATANGSSNVATRNLLLDEGVLVSRFHDGKNKVYLASLVDTSPPSPPLPPDEIRGEGELPPPSLIGGGES